MTTLDAFFRPRGVAFVGATEDPAKLGGRRYKSLVEEGFTGAIHPVHPRAERLRGLPAYRSVLDVPDPVDLAVIVVPTDAVPATLAECARRGIPGVVCITAGFGEVDATGRRIERRMVQAYRASGGRLLGPNCAGLFDAASNLNLGGDAVPRGPISLVSQSGNLLLDFSQHARERGLGFRRQVTIGNAADLGPVELIADAMRDPECKVVLGYLEGFAPGDGRRLVDLARNSTTPIVLVKPGRSEAGRRAALSHTGALAGEDRVADAAFRQAGVHRATSIEGAWDLAAALARGMALGGARLAVISDGGGHATVLSDALGLADLTLPRFRAATRRRLADLLPPRAAIANPVDFAGVVETDPAALPAVLSVCLEAREIDGVVVAGHFGGYHKIGGRALEVREIEAARAVAELARNTAKPVLFHSIHAANAPTALAHLRRAGLPVLRAPESAGPLLAALRRAGRTRRPAAGTSRLRLPEDVRSLLEAPGALAEPESRRFLAAAGIRAPAHVMARSRAAAARASADGRAKAMKLIAPGLIHRSDAGGVMVNVTGARASARAYDALIAKAPGADGVLVTDMIAGGVEAAFGAFRDEQFGAVVMFGLGGVAIEALADVTFRLAPLTRAEAGEMLDEIRARALLAGHRGRPAIDRRAAVDLLVRLGRAVAALPEIAEIDLNPVFLHPGGAEIADARVILANTVPRDHGQPVAPRARRSKFGVSVPTLPAKRGVS